MGKRWIWLVILLSVLILAFLFPRIMLWIIEKDIEKEVLTYGTGTLLNFDALTLSEKQAILASPYTTAFQDDISPEEVDSVRETLGQEMELLSNYGGISPATCNYLLEVLGSEIIRSMRAYDPNGDNIVYFYAIENDQAFVHLDRESGKILSLGAGLDIEKEFTATACETELRSWAEYFGMSVSDLTVHTEHDVLAICKLTGSAEVEFYYAILRNPYSNFWLFRSVSEPTLQQQQQ